MLTYQDYLADNDKLGFIRKLISQHSGSEAVRIANDAEEYYRQRNPFISAFAPSFYDMMGRKCEDRTKVFLQLKNNFFNYLCNQRANYSLGNGISFEQDTTADKLGKSFAEEVSKAGRYAIRHGVSFLFWNVDRVHTFRLAEFAPLWDEETGALRAGVRFWRVDPEKPLFAVLYEEDGYTKLRERKEDKAFAVDVEKCAYRVTVSRTAVDEPEVIGEDNYSRLPIIPVYGSELRQSALVGIRSKLDAYDLISSGFASSINDALKMLVVVSNANFIGDSAEKMQELYDRMRALGIVAADQGQIGVQSQEPPYQAQKACLDQLKEEIFEDFGGLDVHSVMACQTNDHIAAAYEPLNARADDFEDCITTAIRQLLELIGVEDEPTFKRRATNNTAEIVNSVLQAYAAGLIDRQTALELLPIVDTEKVPEIMDRLDAADMQRFNAESPQDEDTDEEEAEE